MMKLFQLRKNPFKNPKQRSFLSRPFSSAGASFIFQTGWDMGERIKVSAWSLKRRVNESARGTLGKEKERSDAFRLFLLPS